MNTTRYSWKASARSASCQVIDLRGYRCDAWPVLDADGERVARYTIARANDGVYVDSGIAQTMYAAKLHCERWTNEAQS